jgi:hypothetical protein
MFLIMITWEQIYFYISGLPGSERKPLIIRTIDDSDSLNELRYYGSNFIIEGLTIINVYSYSRSDCGTDIDDSKIFHPMEVGGLAKASGGGTTFGQNYGGNIDIENVHFHHCGSQGSEVYGITSGVSDVWMLKCYIHHNFGDLFS